MNKKEILQKINELSKLHYQNSGDKYLLELESLLLEYLKQYPRDTDFWIKLAMVEYKCPLEDYDRIFQYIHQIFLYDPYNVNAVLVLAYAQSIYRGEIFDDLYNKLELLKTNNFEINSMISLAKAWYYHDQKNDEKYAQLLLESINYCNKHVKNYIELGRLYIKQGKISEGKALIQHGIKNIKTIYSSDNKTYDVTDLNQFYEEYFKGTSITDSNLKFIQTDLLN